jgi:predicted DNA-binding antitoxin AbrB/MazE fold protein
MGRNKDFTEGEEIKLIIKQNKDLIDALKHLNERLVFEKTESQNQDSGFPEEKILSDKIPVE